MQLNLKGKKILIAGIHGSGKTILAKDISKGFKTAVYTPYPEEWKHEPVLLFEFTDFVNDFPLICRKIKQLALEKKITLFIVDDADILFKTHFDVKQSVREMVISHRHWNNLSLAFVTRRIQDIPAKIYGVCEFKALYTIDSPQAIDLLNKMHEELGDKVKAIPYESYNFYLKKIGEEPRLMKVELPEKT